MLGEPVQLEWEREAPEPRASQLVPVPGAQQVALEPRASQLVLVPGAQQLEPLSAEQRVPERAVPEQPTHL